jgi:hypothetical protein
MARPSATLCGGMASLRRLVPMLTIAAFTVAALPFAMASIIRTMELAELTAAADQIVVADVLSAGSAWDNGHRNIYSTFEISVQESWKGTPPANGRIKIRQLGGTVGEIEMTVLGMPRFTPGERALLFLRQAHVVGMGQGKRQLHWDSTGNRWMADPADRAGAHKVEMRGDSHETEPSQPENLDHLRERVRALMGN